MKQRNESVFWIAPWSFLGRQGYYLPEHGLFVSNTMRKSQPGRSPRTQSRHNFAPEKPLPHRRKLVVNYRSHQLELFALGEIAVAWDEHFTVGDKSLICQDRNRRFYCVTVTQRFFTPSKLRVKTVRLAKRHGERCAELAYPLENFPKGGRFEIDREALWQEEVASMRRAVREQGSENPPRQGASK
jgi:hypothetical protein